MSRMRPPVAGIVLTGLLILGNAHAGPLLNGNFSPDFTPWQGVIENADFDAVAVSPDADARFSLLGGGMARLQTAPAARPIDNIITVDLVQEFSLPASARWIELDYAWAISDPDFDLVEATLESAINPGLFIDLFAGLDTFQPTARGALLTAVDTVPGIAGFDVRLIFRVGDGGDDIQDTLEIGNIALVPTPGSLPLLALGLIASVLVASRKRCSNSRRVPGRLVSPTTGAAT